MTIDDKGTVYRLVKVTFKVRKSRTEAEALVYDNVRVERFSKDGNITVRLTRDGELVAHLFNPVAIDYFK